MFLKPGTCFPFWVKCYFLIFSDNEAPKITSPSEFFKLPGQALVKQLTASDPDPHGGLTFSADTGSPDITVSPNGDLVWAAIANVDTVINVTVTDGCGASSTKQISLRIYNCPCENSGTCKHNSTTPIGSDQYICQCPQDFPGTFCNDTVYGPWSEWSHCSTECGGGEIARTRTCTGARCSSKTHKESKFCNIRPCEAREVCNPGRYHCPSCVPVCQPCPLHTYSQDGKSTQCIQCPKFHVTTTTGSTSSKDCICKCLNMTKSIVFINNVRVAGSKQLH